MPGKRKMEVIFPGQVPKAIVGHRRRHQLPLVMMDHRKWKGNIAIHLAKQWDGPTQRMHWRHTPWRELKGGMALFLQGKGIRVELNLILKTTCTIFIKTTLNDRGFRMTQMRFRHLPFFQQYLQSNLSSQLLPIILSHVLVWDPLIWRRDLEERKGKKSTYPVSCPYLSTATSLSFSDTSLAQAKERGFILN